MKKRRRRKSKAIGRLSPEIAAMGRYNAALAAARADLAVKVRPDRSRRAAWALVWAGVIAVAWLYDPHLALTATLCGLGTWPVFTRLLLPLPELEPLPVRPGMLVVSSKDETIRLLTPDAMRRLSLELLRRAIHPPTAFFTAGILAIWALGCSLSHTIMSDFMIPRPYPMRILEEMSRSLFSAAAAAGGLGVVFVFVEIIHRRSRRPPAP